MPLHTKTWKCQTLYHRLKANLFISSFLKKKDIQVEFNSEKHIGRSMVEFKFGTISQQSFYTMRNMHNSTDINFKFIFMIEICCILVQISLKFVSIALFKYVTIGSCNGLAPCRQQAINWTNVGPVYSRIYVSDGLKELNKTVWWLHSHSSHQHKHAFIIILGAKSELSSCLGYSWEPCWLSLELLEISRVTLTGIQRFISCYTPVAPFTNTDQN